jgi:hypothetical protein
VRKRSYFTQYIHIEDTTAPVITGIVEIELPCDNFEGIYVTVTDNCNEWTIDYDDEPVSGGCQGRILRNYIATDACGNSSTFLQAITLTDVVAPTVVEVADFTVECGSEYVVPAPILL